MAKLFAYQFEQLYQKSRNENFEYFADFVKISQIGSLSFPK